LTNLVTQKIEKYNDKKNMIKTIWLSKKLIIKYNEQVNVQFIDII
jgi:hypothetical protein